MNYKQKEHIYDLGWRTGYRFALTKLLDVKRPTKEDMKRMIEELKENPLT